MSMRLGKYAWKQKIDPAFDQFIKSFLKLLSKWGLSASGGYIHIGESDPYLKNIKEEGFPSFTQFYEDQDLQDVLNSFKTYVDMPKALDQINIIYQKLSKQEFNTDIEAEVGKLTDNIGEESKAYYRKWKVIPNPDQDLSQYINFVSDIISLGYHLSLSSNNGDTKPVLDAHSIQRILFTAWEVASWYINKKPLTKMYDEAKGGIDESLFKLAQIDKTIVDHEWVRTRIRKAMYSGDKVFFESLAKAIKNDPLRSRKLKIEMHLILMNFWYYGLYRLTIPELIQLLEDSGIKIHEDEVTFRKFIDREIKPYYNNLY